MRKSKLVGLLTILVLVIAGAAATHASAAKLVGSAGAVNIHGAQSTTEEFLLTDNSSLKTICTTATFTGSIPAGGTETPRLAPAYLECTAFGLSSTITTSGCEYEFHLGTFNASGTPARTDIECGSGSIVITALTCEVKIKTQGGLTSTTWTLHSGQDATTVHKVIKKMAYEVTKDGIGCPLKGTGSYSEADYSGTTKLVAESGTLKVE